ncbi:MAG: YqhA family protein [Nitrospiraceae bacterium]|nr:YqhA family protein [Nitrospiraceae bacterium]
MLRKIEHIIEFILWESRLVVFFAVVASILSAIMLVVIGCFDVYLVIEEALHSFSSKEAYDLFHQDSITHIISAIDSYLIATVLLIFGIGLYELFISKIERAEKDSRSSKILVIHTLDQLKEKLAKVIVMVLIVTFFKYAVNFKYDSIQNLLYLSAGILFISIALFVIGKNHDSKNKED